MACSIMSSFDIVLFLIFYTLSIMVAGVIGYSIKRDMRAVIALQFVVACILILLADVVVQFTSVLGT